MLPIDNDFLMLYGLYLSILVLLTLGIQNIKFRAQAKWHFISFALYSGLMVSIFMDPNSFENGNAQLVLFYGYVFPMLQFMIFALIQIVKSFKRK